MTDEQTPAQYASDIDAARQRLITFVQRCADGDWRASPLDGDPRPVAVVLDHVAHSYEYLAGWMREILAGQQVEVNADIVDMHNAQHAGQAAEVSQAQAAKHLRASGDVLIELVAGLDARQLGAGDGRVRRFAQIAARHADSHRTDIEAALRPPGSR
jgi:DinB superfamily